MNDNSAPNTSIISAEQVADYLNQHRDFLADRPSLLADMHLVHDTGDAVSLIERQVVLLRKQNNSMRQRMDTLLNNARKNDELFEKTKNLTLSMLNGKDGNDIVDRLLNGFRDDFGIHYISLLIYGEQAQVPAISGIRTVSFNEARKHLSTLIDGHGSICGNLSVKQQAFIFDEQSASINSTAAVSLNHHSLIGLLAIGHSDENYFNTDTDTLFLRYIGDVLSCLLPSKITV